MKRIGLAGLWNKKRSLFLLGVIIAASTIFSACGVSGADQQTETMDTGQNDVQNTGTNNGEETMETEERGSYRVEEIWCENNGNHIYGIAYIPDTGENRRPLVIFSHELGNSHTAGIPYAQRLAEAGYAAYVFDFCGGTVGGNKSDVDNIGMSIMTEVSDLEAVLNTAATWDFVDPDRIVLLGGSQGGAVTALAGCRNQDIIAGMMLMYPALSAVENVHDQFGSIENVPDEYNMFGGWIHVGGNYARDIWNVNFYEELADFEKDVLLLHGDRDTTIDISYSERAAEIIPNCEYHVISGGGHEFFNAQFEDAIGYILSYMNRVESRGILAASESDEEKPEEAVLKMTIGDTPVSVEWEDNASAAALKDLAADGPLRIQMSMYSTFEQVGSLGSDLPRNDAQTTTQAGDIVLYSGNQIVVFYGSNSWSYTRFGHITDKTKQELAELLGNGDVTITILVD